MPTGTGSLRQGAIDSERAAKDAAMVKLQAAREAEETKKLLVITIIMILYIYVYIYIFFNIYIYRHIMNSYDSYI